MKSQIFLWCYCAFCIWLNRQGLISGKKRVQVLKCCLSPSWHSPENNSKKTPWKIVFFLIQNGTSAPHLLTSKCSPCHFVTSLLHHQTASYTGHDSEVIAGPRAWDGNSFGGAPKSGTEEIMQLEWRRELTESPSHLWRWESCFGTIGFS